jgi:hypothetical protein
MSEDKKYVDPELERFLRENKEMIGRLFKEEREMVEKLFKEEKDIFKKAFECECSKAEDFAKEQKQKAKDAAQGMFNAFTDPEVQKHFMKMGMEFMMAMSIIMKAVPVPDFVKDMGEKAQAARKDSSEDGGWGKSLFKVNIEHVSKDESSEEEEKDD